MSMMLGFLFKDGWGSADPESELDGFFDLGCCCFALLLLWFRLGVDDDWWASTASLGPRPVHTRSCHQQPKSQDIRYPFKRLGRKRKLAKPSRTVGFLADQWITGRWDVECDCCSLTGRTIKKLLGCAVFFQSRSAARLLHHLRRRHGIRSHKIKPTPINSKRDPPRSSSSLFSFFYSLHTERPRLAHQTTKGRNTAPQNENWVFFFSFCLCDFTTVVALLLPLNCLLVPFGKIFLRSSDTCNY